MRFSVGVLFCEKKQIEQIRNTNQYTSKFGLSLTDSEIQELLLKRNVVLSEQQRVEFGGGILEKLIFAFCDSEYIYQENYVEMLGELQNIFYLYKNESMDELSDDELIEVMKEAFNKECGGSLEYLKGTCLEQFARDVRANSRKFIGRYKMNNE